MYEFVCTVEDFITASDYCEQVGQFLETVSPYTWATIGIAMCIGLSVVGAAWYENCLFLLSRTDSIIY